MPIDQVEQWEVSRACILRVRLLPNKRCTGCGAIGYAEEKTLLCCYCFGLKVAVEERKRKLTSTLAGHLAMLTRIRAQLQEFKS